MFMAAEKKLIMFRKRHSIGKLPSDYFNSCCLGLVLKIVTDTLKKGMF